MCIGCIPIWHMYYTTFIHVYIIYSIYYSFPPYFIINYTQIMYTSTLLLLISTCYQYSYTLKMVKKYMYYRSTIWGLLPYKNT